MSADPWRFRCPEGHASWTPRSTAGDYYCEACDATFTRLVDAKTGERRRATV